MVPQPAPWSAPVDPRLVVDPTAHTDGEVPPMPFLRNASSRPWKKPKGPTVRTQKSDKSALNWDKRQEARKKDDAVKKLERWVILFGFSRWASKS